MSELEIEDRTEEITKDQIVGEIKDLIFDVCDIVTLDELQKLYETSSYEEFHKLCKQNDMIMRAIQDVSMDPDLWDHYIIALHLFNHSNDIVFDTPQDIIDKFEELTKSQEDTLIYSFLTDVKEIKEFLLNHFPLIGIKVVMEYIEEISSGYSLQYGEYQAKLLCECGTFRTFKHSVTVSNVVDIRDSIKCCSKCGRCCSTWKPVSARKTFLVKTVNKKRSILPGYKTTVIKKSIGFIEGQPLFDKDYEKYGKVVKKKKTSATVNFPGKKKTLRTN